MRLVSRIRGSTNRGVWLAFPALGRIYIASSNLHSEPHAVAQNLRRQTCDAAAALRHTRNTQLCLTTTANTMLVVVRFCFSSRRRIIIVHLPASATMLFSNTKSACVRIMRRSACDAQGALRFGLRVTNTLCKARVKIENTRNRWASARTSLCT